LNIKNKKCQKGKNVKGYKKTKTKICDRKKELHPYNTKKELHGISIRPWTTIHQKKSEPWTTFSNQKKKKVNHGV
jgi:hypothetical protein